MRTLSIGVVILFLLVAVGSIGLADDQPAKPSEPAAQASAKPSNPPTLELELTRDFLKNVEDAPGRWQYEGGQVMQKGEHIASYASTKRIVNKGTEDQNTAML